MNVEIFCLCDAATNQGGKLNILGAFDHVWAKEEPINYNANITIAARLRFASVEEGEKKIRLSFVDIDGKQILPPIEVGMVVKIPTGESTSTLNVVLNIQQIKLPKFGEYSIDLAIDGRQEASLPLYARRMPPPKVESS